MMDFHIENSKFSVHWEWYKMLLNIKIKKKRGRPTKVSEQMDRQILRQAKINPFVSTSQILVETGANVS